MRKLTIVLLFSLLACSTAFAQFPASLLNQIRQIKLLESTRTDAKRILREYEATDDEGYYQEFSNDNVTVKITYSSGTCTADADDEDASEVWNVGEWTVTRIEISPEESIKAANIDLDLSRFRKEPRYPNDSEALVFYDKRAGFAVKTTEGEIETLIFFPARANSAKLCPNSTAAKGFYIRKGWFTQARPYDYGCVLTNLPANVEEMNLSAVEINHSSTRTVSVFTVAKDPENDVLTYNYTVTAGRIIGQGASVEWDLTGVAAGTYSITVGVDDGMGIVGKIITKAVTIK